MNNKELTIEEIQEAINSVIESDIKCEITFDPIWIKYDITYRYYYKWVKGKCSKITFPVDIYTSKENLQFVTKRANYSLIRHITNQARKQLEEKNIESSGWLTQNNIIEDIKLKDFYQKYKDTEFFMKQSQWPSCSIIDEIYFVQSQENK